MKTLRLANEYLAGPIFCPDPEKMGHVDVEDLPISSELQFALREWDEEYQSTFNIDYPPDSGFASPTDEQAYIKRGKDLAERLQLELGDGYLVQYKS